jgi:hypothetical protein
MDDRTTARTGLSRRVHLLSTRNETVDRQLMPELRCDVASV